MHKVDAYDALAAGIHVFFNKPSLRDGVFAVFITGTLLSWVPVTVMRAISWSTCACGLCANVLVMTDLGVLGMVFLYPWYCYVLLQLALEGERMSMQFVALGVACFLGPVVATVCFAELLCKLVCIEVIACLTQLRS